MIVRYCLTLQWVLTRKYLVISNNLKIILAYGQNWQTEEALRGRSLHYIGVDEAPIAKEAQRNEAEAIGREPPSIPTEVSGPMNNLKTKIFDVFGIIK